MTSKPARVVVIGTSCAGKTKFARFLSGVLHCPHVELDTLYWQPNWLPRTADEFRALTAQALSRNDWVTDGNYAVVRDLVWSRATTVIWLNYSFQLVLCRALTRTVRRVLTREELAAAVELNESSSTLLPSANSKRRLSLRALAPYAIWQ